MLVVIVGAVIFQICELGVLVVVDFVLEERAINFVKFVRWPDFVGSFHEEFGGSKCFFDSLLADKIFIEDIG